MKFTGNKIKIKSPFVICNIKRVNRSKVLSTLEKNGFIRINDFREDTFKEVNINLNSKMYWCTSIVFAQKGNIEEKDLFNIIECNYEIIK